MGNDIKKLGMLVLALLAMVILVGVTFLVSNEFQANLCAQAEAGSTYDGSSCLNSSGGAFSGGDPAPVTNTETVITAIVTVLSFLGIVVIVAIARIILKLAKGMQ